MSDAQRLTVEELDELLSGAFHNPTADTDLMVDDYPVLTDRGFVHVTAGRFGPTDTSFGGLSDPEFWHTGGFVDGGSLINCTDAVAPVFLPEGVTVDSLALLAEDDSPLALEVYLTRRHAYFDQSETMSYFATDADTAGVRIWFDGTIDHPKIQNGIYQYDLMADCLTAHRKLRSVFIYYTY